MLHRYLILAFFWILPVQFALHPMTGVDMPLSRVMASLIVFCWLGESLIVRRLVLPKPVTLGAFLSFVFIVLSSILWADNALWAARKGFFIATYFLLFPVFYAVLQDRTFQKKLIVALVGGAGGAAIIGIVQFFAQFAFGVERVFRFWIEKFLPFFLGPAFSESVAAYPSLLVNVGGKTILRATAFFPDPHMFSFYLGMIIPLAVALMLQSQGKKHLFWAVSAGLLLIADLLTFSRGGYIGLAVGFFLAIGFWLVTIESTHWKRWWKYFIGLLLILTLFPFSPFGNRLISSFSPVEGSNKERLRLWSEAAGYIALRPLTGTGIGNYPLLVKPSAGYREPIYVHNLYLDIAVEVGLVGAGAFILWMAISMFHSFRIALHKRDVARWAVFSGLLIFSVHSCFDTSLFSVQALPVFLLLQAWSIVDL